MLIKNSWILWLLLLLQERQTYLVVNQHTGAHCKTYNRELQAGDRLTGADSVYFPTGSGIVRLADDKGTYAIRPDAHFIKVTKGQPEFWQLVKNVVWPTAHRQIAAGRSGGYTSLYTLQNELRAYDSDSTALIIADSLMLDLPFVQALGYRFYLQYGNTAHLLPGFHKDGSYHLYLTGPASAGAVLVTLIEETPGQHRLPVSEFYVNFINRSAWLPELRLVVKGLPADKAAERARDYLAAYYGLVENHDFDHHLLPLIFHP